jgi:hypothetical protein
VERNVAEIGRHVAWAYQCKDSVTEAAVGLVAHAHARAGVDLGKDPAGLPILSTGRDVSVCER